MTKYVHVSVNIPSLIKPLAFKANGLNLSIGDVVVVPVKSKYKSGIVTDLKENENEISKIDSIKPINQILDKQLLDKKQIQLSKQIADYYCTPIIEAVKLFLPPAYNLKIVLNKKNKKYEFVKPPMKSKEKTIVKINNNKKGLTEKQEKIMKVLTDLGEVERKKLLEISEVSSAVLKGLEYKEIVGFEKRKVTRMPVGFYKEEYKKPVLNREQEEILADVSGALKRNHDKEYLLFGVTASGKTEIYLRIIDDCLKIGKTAIYLLPEISLTPQVNSRLRTRFGNTVAILHSNMSAGERYDQYKGVKEGKYKIVAGPRSALFAPLKNLGLIVIDEEQEASYKQNRSPRYDARTVSLFKARQENAVVVFGSATPSIETLYKADKNEFKLLKLKKRAVGDKAKVSLVNLRKEPNKDDCISRYLKDKLSKLEDDSKSVIFLNRRGFSGFVICRNCGNVPTCPDCDVSLTLHGQYLICHYCNKIHKFNNRCQQCNAFINKYLAAGTQRVEWEIKNSIKDIPVVRMDSDTTSKKGGHDKQLTEFRKREKSVLVGTQMIAKGLDYPDVAVVGAVNTDIGLNMPDFRSSERVFQTIYQLIGRAGRGNASAEVVLQTYEPENETVKDLLKGDYYAFYEREIKRRKELDYPPFSKLINIGIRGKNKDKVKEVAKLIEKKINMKNIKGIKSILGPSSAPLGYIKKYFRWHILLKLENSFSNQQEVCKTVNSCKRKGVVVAIDVDPISML